MCFASGLAAIDAVIKLLKPGDEVVSTNDLCSGTYRIFTKVFENYGINFKFVGMENAQNIEDHITANTKLIWVETPTNPMLTSLIFSATAKVAKKHGILLGVDNTFASPYLQNPMDLGADLVVHSVTKYLGGHSDIVMGALMLNDDTLAERLCFAKLMRCSTRTHG